MGAAVGRNQALKSRVNILLASVAWLPVAVAPVWGQETSVEAGSEKVVVTGRRSVAPSLSKLRKDEDAIADSLTSKQIEELPDTSLAQTLDRIVGVSSDRGFGTSEARTVTVRGFDARYNSMTVDGIPIWNSSRNNRGTQLDVFPAAVVAQVDVFKTVTADFDANSIGGHVQMRTLRAFDGGTQPYLRARAFVGAYDQSGTPFDNETSFRVDAGGKFTFGDANQFGVVLGGDFQRHDFHDEVAEVTGYGLVSGVDVLNGSAFRGIFQRETQTYSLFGKLETRVADQLYAFASLSYFDDQRDENWNRGGIFVASNRVTNPTAFTGDFTRGTAENYFETYLLDRKTLQASAGVDYRLGELTSITARASFLDYDHDEELYRSERFQFANLTGSYVLLPEQVQFTVNPIAGLTDPALWLHRTGRNAFNALLPHQDQVYHGRVDLKHNSFVDSEGLGFEAGAYWRRLDRTHDRATENWQLPAGTVYSLANAALFPDQDPDAINPFFIDIQAYKPFLVSNGVFSITTDDASDYTLIEDVAAGYATAILDLGALRVLGGVRVEHTSFDNVTASTEAGVLVPDVRNIDYTNVLPNLQVTYELTNTVRFKAAATRTLARPDFSDFAFGQAVTFDGNGNSVINGANPELGPRISNNYDLGFDWFLDQGFFSIGVFQEFLEDETFRERRETRDANGIVILTETIPLNTGKARVNGFEISYVHERFDFLPAPFDKFGFYGNFTDLNGDWEVVFTDGSTRTVDGLRNQPKWLANLNLTFAHSFFDATLAYRLRGRTFTGTFGTTARDDLWVDSYGRLDFTANAKLGDGVKLTFQARNLNDAVWIEQSGVSESSLRNAYAPGRTFWLGLSWKPEL